MEGVDLFVKLYLVCCLALVGSCTDCQGTDFHGYLNGLNIESFQGCNEVNGNMVINQMSLQGEDLTDTPPISLDQLSYLTSIKEITGYLLIENLDNSNITNLRFLRNLEVLHGMQTVEYRPGQHYSLVIDGNDHLQTLSLSSLQRIENGGIRISGNPQLCLVDTLTVEEYLVTSSLRRIGGLGMDCSAFTCHEQCALNEGCWGVLPDECVECRNYNYMGTCLESCDMDVSFIDNSTKQCLPLVPPTTSPTNQPTTSNRATTTMATSSTSDTLTETNSPSATTLQHINESDTDQSTRTSSVTVPTSVTDPDVHKETPQWAVLAGGIAGIVVVILVFCAVVIVVACCRHCSRKSQSKSLPKEKRVDKEGKEDERKDNASELSQSEKSLRESNANSRSFRIATPIQSTVHEYYQVTESCDNHMTFQQDSSDSTPPFTPTPISVSEKEHNEDPFQLLTDRSCTPSPKYATHTPSILATKPDLEIEHSPTAGWYTSNDQRVSYSLSTTSSHSSPKFGYKQSQASLTHRPMTGGIYSTRTSPSHSHSTHPSPSLHTPSHHHSTRSSPSHLHRSSITPSRSHTHRGSLSSSHGGSISRASTITSRTSNHTSTGSATVSSGRIRLSVHGSDSSLTGLQEQYSQMLPYCCEES